MKTILILLTIVMTACGRTEYVQGPPGEAGGKGDPGAVVETPPPVLPTEIESLLKDENVYRLSLGQTALTQGLSCALFSTTGGDRIQATSGGHTTLQGLSQVATFLLNKVLNQPETPVSDGMNVLPAALRSLYTNAYLLRCQGQLVVTSTDYYTFNLNSDDASVLYLDGAKVIDNDNAHGPTVIIGQRFMRRGVHSFRLDYAQTGGGTQALVLKAGTSDNTAGLIQPEYLFH